MSTLGTLPLEIQYHIARLLPISSLSALARSSRCLHLNLGSEIYQLAASHEHSHFFLWCCIQRHNVQAFKRILSHGASLTASSNCQDIFSESQTTTLRLVYLVCQHDTLLHSAAMAGDTEIISILLEHGFKIHSFGSNDTSCLESAAKKAKNTAVIKLLLDEGTAKYGADYVLGFLDEAILAAAQRNYIDNLELMMEYHRSHTKRPLCVGIYGMFYSWTSDNDCAHVVRMLLENGAYIDDALVEAVQVGLLEVTRVLIEYGADVNSICQIDGGPTVTPLLEVAKLASLGTEDMYRYLNCDMKMMMMMEDRLKDWIAKKAQPAVCIEKILVESGADPEVALSLLDSSMAEYSSEGREACRTFLTNLRPRPGGGEETSAT